MHSSTFKSPLLKALILSAAIAVTGGVTPAFAQKKQPQADENWITYKNERFGYQLHYPAAVFVPKAPDDDTDEDDEEDEGDDAETGDAAGSGSADGDTLTLLSNDGKAKIVTFAAVNSDSVTPDEYRKTLLDEFGGYDKLDYQPAGKSWFVLSGYRGDTIYYQKVMFSCQNKVVNVFSVNFPTAEKPYYERLVEIMEDKFKTGRGTDTPAGC